MNSVNGPAPKWSALAQQEQERTDFEVAEEVLVRDVLYACQGVNGKYVHYNPQALGGEGAHELANRAGIPPSRRKIILAICELGWLFRHIQQSHSSLGSGEPGTSSSAIRQALFTAVQQEFAEYYRLMAVLELQAARQPLGSSDARRNSSGTAPAGTGLTLRRLAVWLATPTLQMRWLAALIDSTADLPGGALISAVEAFAQHGDPAVRACVLRVLRVICGPLLRMVHAWVFDGRLDSGAEEFFVVRQHLRGRGADAPGPFNSVQWGSRYQLDSALVPSFISPKLAGVILRAGKSINFLRECKSDSEWIQGGRRAALVAAAAQVAYSQMEGWEDTIAAAAAGINQHVVETVLTRYALVKHCDAMRRYLLLGQGDFVQSLMDQIGTQLNAPAAEVSEFALNGTLDAAIRASNAQFDDADVLARLRVKVEKGTAAEAGWDVFALWYQLDEPLTTVIPQTAVLGYLRLFRLLWVIKRAEHTLSQAWQAMNGMQRQLAVIQALEKEHGVSCPGVAQVWSVLRQCHSLRIEMVHFCNDLQTYIAFEVLDASWDAFLSDLKGVADLDEIIAAHSRYLDVLVRKALLDEGARGGGGRSVGAELQGILRQMLDILGPMRRLNEAVEMAAVEVKMQTSRQMQLREEGQWGSTLQLKGVPQDTLLEVQAMLQQSLQAYQAQQQQFVSTLATLDQVDLSGLIYRLDMS